MHLPEIAAESTGKNYFTFVDFLTANSRLRSKKFEFREITLHQVSRSERRAMVACSGAGLPELKIPKILVSDPKYFLKGI